MTITITPISDQMGASITGITGAEAATPEVARQLQGALDEYGVVVLPELNISDDDLAALARLLGEVVLPPYGALADHPEISPVTRDPNWTNSPVTARRTSTGTSTARPAMHPTR